jgi:hypothetical protein
MHLDPDLSACGHAQASGMIMNLLYMAPDIE